MSFFNFDSDSIEAEKDFYELNIEAESTQVPTGWSSICLDDTITYYIECNMSLAKNRTDTNLY